MSEGGHEGWNHPLDCLLAEPDPGPAKEFGGRGFMGGVARFLSEVSTTDAERSGVAIHVGGSDLLDALHDPRAPIWWHFSILVPDEHYPDRPAAVVRQHYCPGMPARHLGGHGRFKYDRTDAAQACILVVPGWADWDAYTQPTLDVIRWMGERFGWRSPKVFGCEGRDLLGEALTGSSHRGHREVRAWVQGVIKAAAGC